MAKNELVIVALSGGVDSAVSALVLQNAGYQVECLHMSNWEDDGYCESAKDFQDARQHNRCGRDVKHYAILMFVADMIIMRLYFHHPIS